MTANLRRLYAVTALLALLLVACGGGDGGSGSGATTTAPGSTEATGATGASADQDDLARARAAAITVGDLPDGWRMVAETEDTPDFGAGDEDDMAALRESCPELENDMEVLLEAVGDPADVSRSFVVGTGTPTLESSPAVFADEQDAAQAFELMLSDVLVECLGTTFRQGMIDRQDATVGEVDITRIEIAPGDADTAGGLRLLLPMTIQGQDLMAEFDIAVIRAGAIVHSLMGFGIQGAGAFSDFGAVTDLAIERTTSAAS